MSVRVCLKLTCAITDTGDDDHRANFGHDSVSNEESRVSQGVQLLCNSTGCTRDLLNIHSIQVVALICAESRISFEWRSWLCKHI